MVGSCGSTCPVEGGFYSFEPNKAGSATLLALYALLVPLVLYLGFRLRTPLFSAVLTAGLLLEVLGFIGRIMLNGARDNEAHFFLTQFGTVLGPAFMSNAVFLILPHLLGVYGEHLFPLPALYVGLAFAVFSALSFILQLIGIVFVAYGFNGISGTKGADIVASGLGIQAVALAAFCGLHFWIVLGLAAHNGSSEGRHVRVYSSKHFRRFSMGLQLAVVVLIVFSVYRVVEFSGSVSGSLFQNQPASMVVGGTFPLLACIILTLLHPGKAFGRAWAATTPRAISRPQPIEVGLPVHDRYDPEIRKQLSPNSQRRYRSSLNPPGLAAGSPGLPPNPKPVAKSLAPTTPTTSSRPSSMPSSTQDKRSSSRIEIKGMVQKRDLVNSDDVW